MIENLNEVIENYLTLSIKSENTRRSYRKSLDCFCEFLEDLNLRVEEMQNYHMNIFKNILIEEKNFEPSTVNNRLSALHSFYKFLEKNDYVPYGKANKIKVDFEKVENVHDIYLNQEEISMLLKYLKNRDRVPYEKNFEFSSKRDLFYVALAIKTGFRYCEIAYLKESDFDFDEMLITLPWTVRKNKKALTMPIDNEIKKLFDEYVKERNIIKEKFDVDDNLFISLRGKVLDNSCVNSEIIRKNIRNANIYFDLNLIKFNIREDISIHKLRHTAAYTMLNNNFTLVETARMLGHTSIRSTERYVHTSVDDLRKKQFNILE